MEIINTTDFVFAPLTGRVNFPGHSLTLIVKGTFDLKHGAPATIANEQLYPTGDEYHPGDEDVKSLRYDSDFAYYKASADLLLVGTGYTPGGRPLPSCRVTFQVGHHQSSLALFGDRYWRPIVKTISPPALFSVMDIRYEKSFGGRGYEKNPLGLGITENQTSGDNTPTPLPNIENIHQLITSPASRPEPAGFGPLDRMWQQRFTKLGSYDQTWLGGRWPWFPTDFSWQYYNAAPDNMQVGGYLKGDETLYFENLHPSTPEYNSQLPRQRVRCFISKSNSRGQNEACFDEVVMNLDTLWVDMEVEKMVLVWRGNTDIDDEEYEEISGVYIVSEQVGDVPRLVDQHHEDLMKILVAEDDDFTEETPEDKALEQPLSIEDELQKSQEVMRNELLAAGIDPDEHMAEPSQQDKEAQARIFEEHGLGQITQECPLTRESIIEKLDSGESLVGEDFSGLDLSGLNMSGRDFKGAIFINTNLANVSFDGATLVETQFENADLSGASLRKINGVDADFTRACLNNVDFSESLLSDAVFEGAQVANGNFDRAQMLNGYFSGVDLSGSSLKDALCDSVDFSKALLHKTDFSGSSLREASVEGAHGDNLIMSGCDLTELRASERCCFFNGDFKSVTGVESIWEQAQLDGSDFSDSDMMGADFSSTTLKKVIFQGANMKQARFIKADLTGATCVGMNLFESSLEKANLTGADFSGSNLYGAEFLEAKLDNTNFRSANLKMSKLFRKQG